MLADNNIKTEWLLYIPSSFKSALNYIWSMLLYNIYKTYVAKKFLSFIHMRDPDRNGHEAMHASGRY